MRAKDREVAKAKEERDAGRAAERERAKVGRVVGVGGGGEVRRGGGPR